MLAYIKVLRFRRGRLSRGRQTLAGGANGSSDIDPHLLPQEDLTGRQRQHLMPTRRGPAIIRSRVPWPELDDQGTVLETVGLQEAKTVKNRLHLDLCTDQRLIGLGATPIRDSNRATALTESCPGEVLVS
jgi:hypothetical protein